MRTPRAGTNRESGTRAADRSIREQNEEADVMTEKTGKHPACPKCGSEQVVPIGYGLPGPEMAAMADRGEIVLGGCVIEPDAPRWSCKACGWEWREDDRG